MSEEPESTIDNSDQWVSDLITEAREYNPTVSDGVFTRLGTLLKGRISEKNLTPTELKTVATQLIGDMIPKV